MNIKRILATAAFAPLAVVGFAGAASALGQHDYDSEWEINYNDGAANCDHHANVEDEDGNDVDLAQRIRFFAENASNPNNIEGFYWRGTDRQGSGQFRDSEANISTVRVRYYDADFSKATSPRGEKIGDYTYTASVRDGKHTSAWQVDGVETAIVSAQWTNTGSNDGGDSFQLTCVIDVEDAQ